MKNDFKSGDKVLFKPEGTYFGKFNGCKSQITSISKDGILILVFPKDSLETKKIYAFALESEIKLIPPSSCKRKLKND